MLLSLCKFSLTTMPRRRDAAGSTGMDTTLSEMPYITSSDRMLTPRPCATMDTIAASSSPV